MGILLVLRSLFWVLLRVALALGRLLSLALVRPGQYSSLLLLLHLGKRVQRRKPVNCSRSVRIYTSNDLPYTVH